MAAKTDRQAVKAVPGQRASCTVTPARTVPAARSPNMRPAATACDPACKSCARDNPPCKPPWGPQAVTGHVWQNHTRLHQ